MTPLSRPSKRRLGVVLTTTLAVTGLIASSAAGATFFNSGGIANGAGNPPDGPGVSILDTTAGDTVFGFGASAATGTRVADDFTVGAGGWKINGFELFTYQTGSTTTSTITAATVRIWDGPPDLTPADTGAKVVYGDDVTNRLASSVFSGVYRVTSTTLGDTTRPMMRTTVSTPTTLPAGTYWVDYQFAGSLASGPWAPPVTVAPVAGNAQQLTGGAWTAVTDNSVPRALPFKVLGDPDTAVTAGTVAGTTATFTYTGTPAGVTTGFECKLDAGAYAACPGGSKSYPGLAAGDHTFLVRSLIGAEADPTPASKTVTVTATADTTAPKLTLTGKAAQKAKKIVAAVGCDEACTATVTAKLTAIKGGKKTSVTLKPVTVSVSANGTVTVKLALTGKAKAAAKAALRSGGTAVVKLKASAKDAAGNVSKKAKLKVKLS